MASTKKGLIIGDPLLPSDEIYERVKKLEEQGFEFTLMDWKGDLSHEDFRFMTTQVEDEGPGSFEATEIKDEIEDTEIVVVHYGPLSREVIEKGKKLDIIGVARGGFDNVDTEAAEDNDVTVLHSPGRNRHAVADFTWALLLAWVRRIPKLHADMKDHKWESIDLEDLPFDLKDKTLGIIGFGNVGQEVARRANGFLMDVLIHDPYVDQKTADEFDAEILEMDELLEKSDIVSLNARLTPETRHLVGEEEFRKMKDSALVVNTARGGLIDEESLVKALEEGWIAGAALDVFEKEPIPEDHPIRDFDNVVLSPHVAGGTHESLFVIGPSTIADQIEDIMNGKKAEHYVVSP